ncbi:35633_t:CDS:1 [Gigaspora margarita]|uniref:35633_t:CDS:1 n=1 Tax=Gigaspora margarita TaxID=4874 RepID=A0ABN7VVV2_GIGMA|nr:35633_t:CDS:1 [Gigaspora margarita]
MEDIPTPNVNHLYSSFINPSDSINTVNSRSTSLSSDELSSSTDSTLKSDSCNYCGQTGCTITETTTSIVITIATNIEVDANGNSKISSRIITDLPPKQSTIRSSCPTRVDVQVDETWSGLNSMPTNICTNDQRNLTGSTESTINEKSKPMMIFADSEQHQKNEIKVAELNLIPNSEQEQNQEQTSFGLNEEPDKMFQTSELILDFEQDQTSYVKQMSPDHIPKIGMVSTSSIQNQVSEITQMEPVSNVFHRELHSNVMESSSDIGAQNDQTRNRFYRFHPDDFASIRQTRACLPRKKSSMSKGVLTARK